MAGIIGSNTYGVAKQTRIYAVKVLDANGNGDWSTIISGLQFAVNDSRSRSCPNGVVVNMSLGGGKSRAMDDAVAATVNAGIPGEVSDILILKQFADLLLIVFVAAGNDAFDYTGSSPADSPSAFAVGGTDSSDNIAPFSNYGRNLGAFAPAQDVISLWNNGGTVSLFSIIPSNLADSDRKNTMSGTSMSTPYVTGLAAYLLALNGGPMSPQAMRSWIQSFATKDRVVLGAAAQAGTPNFLAFNGAT